MDKRVRDYLRARASEGGKARAKKLTKAQRQAIARKAVRARWAAAKKRKWSK